MDPTELLLRALGLFYVFAGWISSRAGLTSHMLDRALAGISASKPNAAETAQAVWLLASSWLVLAGGVALALMSELAAPLFVLSALGQAAYLAVVAPRWFDPVDPPDTKGRQQTRNAFYVYTAVTAAILLAASDGRPTPWQDIAGPLRAAGLAVAALHAGYILIVFWKIRR